MSGYLEALFRHRTLIVALLLLSIVASVGRAALAPPTFTSVVRIWLTASVGESQSRSLTSPADAAATSLQELLGGREFCLSVASRGPLLAYLRNPANASRLGYEPFPGLHLPGGRNVADGTPAEVSDLVHDVINKGVSVTPLGWDVVAVTFVAVDPALAHDTLQALLDEYTDRVVEFERLRAQQMLTAANQQVDAIAADVNSADAALRSHVRAHPALSSANPPRDAQFAALSLVDKQQHDRYAAAVREADRADLRIAALRDRASAGIRPVDPPSLPPMADPIDRVLLGALAGGAITAAIVIALALWLMVGGDRAANDRIPKTEILGGTIIGRIRRLRTTSAQLESGRRSARRPTGSATGG